jgi:vacuolar protein sorting-associated protein 3
MARTPGPSFSHSNVVVIASDSISSLFPSTLITQVECLLESHRIQEAADVADQQKKQLLQGNEQDEVRISQDVLDVPCVTAVL